MNKLRKNIISKTRTPKHDKNYSLVFRDTPETNKMKDIVKYVKCNLMVSRHINESGIRISIQQGLTGGESQTELAQAFQEG